MAGWIHNNCFDQILYLISSMEHVVITVLFSQSSFGFYSGCDFKSTGCLFSLFLLLCVSECYVLVPCLPFVPVALGLVAFILPHCSVLDTFSFLYVGVQRQTSRPQLFARVCVCMYVWLCGGSVCLCVCISVCMHVCARLAPGSWAITLYEVWQGESKTSASPKKSPGLGLILGLGTSAHTNTQTELLSEKHTHTHTAGTFRIHGPWCFIDSHKHTLHISKPLLLYSNTHAYIHKSQ